jgi:hypothetical protein
MGALKWGLTDSGAETFKIEKDNPLTPSFTTIKEF